MTGKYISALHETSIFFVVADLGLNKFLKVNDCTVLL